MKILLLILLQICLVTCKERDYLIVLSGNKLRLISLDSKTIIDPYEFVTPLNDGISKIIIEHDPTRLRVFYFWVVKNRLDVLEIKDGNINNKEINLSNQYILDFDKIPRTDVYYYSTNKQQVFKKDLSTTNPEKSIVKSTDLIGAIAYDSKDNYLYYAECAIYGNAYLKRIKASNDWEEMVIQLSFCPRKMVVDVKERQLYYTNGTTVDVVTLNSKPVITNFYNNQDIVFYNSVLGSKHFYYAKDEAIYRFEKKPNKEAELFHKFETGSIGAIAIFEGSVSPGSFLPTNSTDDVSPGNFPPTNSTGNVSPVNPPSTKSTAAEHMNSKLIVLSWSAFIIITKMII